MAVQLISANGGIRPPAHPAQVEQIFGAKAYVLGLETLGFDQRIHLFEGESGVWTPVFTFDAQECAGSEASLHVLGSSLAIVFTARYDHVASDYVQDWILHVLVVNPADWTYTVRRAPGAHLMRQPLGRPMIFDSKSVNGTVHVCFDCMSNSDMEAARARVAYARITETTLVADILDGDLPDPVRSIYVDYSTVDDIVFAAVNVADYHYLYQIAPRVVLMTELFNLRESQYCSRFQSIYDFRANVGMTQGTPSALTIHHTYNIAIPPDASALAFQFYTDHWVIFFRSQDKLWAAVFDLRSVQYLGAKKVLDEFPAAFNIPKDDGADRVFAASSVYYAISGGYYRLSFDAVTAVPELVEPIQNAYINTAAVEFVLRSPVETQGNNLNFKVRVTRHGVTQVFSSEIPTQFVDWFYQENGAWVPLPGTGLPPANQGTHVMARIGRGAFQT